MTFFKHLEVILGDKMPTAPRRMLLPGSHLAVHAEKDRFHHKHGKHEDLDSPFGAIDLAHCLWHHITDPVSDMRCLMKSTQFMTRWMLRVFERVMGTTPF